MSKTTKIKHVTKEILSGKGNNLHEVEDPSGSTYLVSMPTKFRKNIWVKRGDFVIVEPIEEGDKVKAEIVRILYREQVKYIKEEGKWPKAFDDGEAKGDAEHRSPEDSDSDDDDDDLFVNTNRPSVVYEESESSSTEEEAN
ncbi:conserved hypothetical protein [Ixodes scapularis]|uniref:Probable RNA-binding protein EIF1AD n=1 Tax=Ixodes scapularis TaxID=6945 RepID=B7P9A2_IXOSC|nr:conserved hypothetical protein [Ixodes scapularis]|eukprot:XP_002403797.1 conserved hypothetical protein [Ixodes scapularis]